MQLRFGALLTVILVLTTGAVVEAAPSREDLARIEARAKARQQDLETLRAQATEARRDVDSAAADLELLYQRGGRLITPDDDEWPALALAAFAGAS